MTVRPKLAVILGAGASYDCCPDKGAIADETWRPPTVANLFETGAFDLVLNDHEQAYALFSPIRSRMRGGKTLEEALREQVDRQDPDVQRMLPYLPIALHEYFYRVSSNYVREAVNYSALLNETIGRGFHTAFITVNYDTLLEQSLRRWTGRNLQTADDYLADNWLLAKLHGSVGWGWLWHSPTEHRRPQVAIGKYDLPDRKLTEIDVAVPPEMIRGRALFYPALALPVPGKGDFLCPPTHVNAIQEFLQDCLSYLFIGFSANDTDVLQLLTDSVPFKTCAVKVVAGNQREAGGVIQRLQAGVRQFRQLYPAVVTPSITFTHFLEKDSEPFFLFARNLGLRNK